MFKNQRTAQKTGPSCQLGTIASGHARVCTRAGHRNFDSEGFEVLDLDNSGSLAVMGETSKAERHVMLKDLRAIDVGSLFVQDEEDVGEHRKTTTTMTPGSSSVRDLGKKVVDKTAR